MKQYKYDPAARVCHGLDEARKRGVYRHPTRMQDGATGTYTRCSALRLLRAAPHLLCCTCVLFHRNVLFKLAFFSDYTGLDFKENECDVKVSSSSRDSCHGLDFRGMSYSANMIVMMIVMIAIIIIIIIISFVSLITISCRSVE